MFSLNKKTQLLPLSTVVTRDLQTLKQNVSLDDLTRVARAFIKAIIGRTHEYTFEESLFILREEGYINSKDYEVIKRDLLKIAYMRYSEKTITESQAYLVEIIDDFLRILPDIKPADNEEALVLYKKEVSKSPIDERAQNRLKSKMYKEEILKTEQQISEQFNKKVEHQSQEHPQNALKIPFSDFFEAIMGYPLERQIQLDFSSEDKSAIIWDLYNRYYQLRGDSPEQIREIFEKYGISTQQISSIIQRNQDYLASISRFMYLEDMIKATIRITLQILLNFSVDDIMADMRKKGYNKELALFVLANILLEPTHRTP